MDQEMYSPFLAGPEETDVACLLIHGFMSSPLEMRGLGEELGQQGIRVYAITVAGHTGSPEDLLDVGHKEWIASAEAGLARLARYPCIFVAGVSMGGVLALLLASHHPESIAGVVTMSAFARLSPNSWQRHLLPLLPLARYFVKWFYPLSWSDLKDPVLQEEILDHALLEYPDTTVDFSDPQAIAAAKRMMRVPVHALEELIYLTKEVRRRLPAVQSPLLIVHSRRDWIARPACADELYRLAAAARLKSLRWLERSHHDLTIGPEREEVYRAVLAFIKERAETRERADTVPSVVHRHLTE